MVYLTLSFPVSFVWEQDISPPCEGACLFLEGREKNVNKQICFSSLPGHWQEIISLVQQYLPILINP